MSVVKCINLSKQYEDILALNEVNLTIEKGEFFGLLGPNGAGKTTLLKILTGQLRTTKGEAEILGMNIENNIMEVKRKIAIIFKKV